MGVSAYCRCGRGYFGYFIVVNTRVPMEDYGNPDALEDDAWWLDRNESGAKGQRKRSRNSDEDEGRVKKRKRKKISEILAVTEVASHCSGCPYIGDDAGQSLRCTGRTVRVTSHETETVLGIDASAPSQGEAIIYSR